MNTETESIKAARKNHTCDWCGQRIEAGQPYKRYRWFGNDQPVTVREHPECYGAMLELSAEFREEVEFSPGDYPRGCWCDFDVECETCRENQQGVFRAESEEVEV